MSQYSKQFANWNKKYNKYKEKYHDLLKKKSDLLLLNQKPEGEIVSWPIKISGKNQKETGPMTSTRNETKQHRYRHFVAKPYDPLFREPYKQLIAFRNSTRCSQRKRNRQAESREYMDLFLTQFLSHDLKPKPIKPLLQDTVSFIKDQSADMMDQVLLSIANSRAPVRLDDDDDQEEEKEEKEEDSDKEGKNVLDWEFVLGNLVQTGLPPSVIDRVKRRMALITGKNTPAISAMNVVQPLILSDLLITSAEVKAQKDLEKLIEKSQQFESRPEDDVFEESVKWLIDTKDQDTEIQKINQDYTERVLDLKPAFF